MVQKTRDDDDNRINDRFTGINDVYDDYGINDDDSGDDDDSIDDGNNDSDDDDSIDDGKNDSGDNDDDDGNNDDDVEEENNSEEINLEGMFEPLYHGAKITVCGAFCAIMHFKCISGCSFSAVVQLLQLLQLLCPFDNKLPQSVYILENSLINLELQRIVHNIAQAVMT